MVINGRDREKLDAAARSLAQEGLNVGVYAFDVTEAPAVAANVSKIERDNGAIDILVNNAAISGRKPFVETRRRELAYRAIDECRGAVSINARRCA